MKKLIAFVTSAAIMVAIALTFISLQGGDDGFINTILTWTTEKVQDKALEE